MSQNFRQQCTALYQDPPIKFEEKLVQISKSIKQQKTSLMFRHIFATIIKAKIQVQEGQFDLTQLNEVLKVQKEALIRNIQKSFE